MKPSKVILIVAIIVVVLLVIAYFVNSENKKKAASVITNQPNAMNQKLSNTNTTSRYIASSSSAEPICGGQVGCVTGYSCINGRCVADNS